MRGPLAKLVETLDQNITRVFHGTPDEWYAAIGDHRLVLCPRGNGLDTHRAWETLYVGRIPVVVTSSMDAAFDGLPVIILDSWGELRNTSVLAAREASVIRGMASGAYDVRHLRLQHFVCQIMAAAGRMTPGAIAQGITC